MHLPVSMAASVSTGIKDVYYHCLEWSGTVLLFDLQASIVYENTNEMPLQKVLCDVVHMYSFQIFIPNIDRRIEATSNGMG